MEINFEDIEISFDEAKKLVIVKNEGRRSYPKIREFIKEVRRKLKGPDPKLNLLIDWTEFQGFDDSKDKTLEPSAIELSEMVHKVAIITGPEWDIEAERWSDFFCYMPIERFRPDDRDKAMDWLSQPT